MSAVRSAKGCIALHQAILFGVCIICGLISILLLVAFGFLIFHDYKMTGMFNHNI